MYRTIPIRGNFNDWENDYWADQCRNASSLINCAIYYLKQKHYQNLSEMDNSRSLYWRGDELRSGWKTYQCNIKYPELDKALKQSPHYKALAAQAAQQTLKSVGESITSYDGLVKAYYKGEVDRPKLPKYRKKGGLAAVTFPAQALTYKDGRVYPSVSKGTKPYLFDEISLALPPFIDFDWLKEVTVRPNLSEFWIDWVIDDDKVPIATHNPNLDYSQAWSYDHGGTNWLTGVSTLGESLIIDGRKLKSINQGYCRLVAKYKQGKSNFHWDSNLDRVQHKRNNQIRDAINKAARFIVNRCLSDGVGNLVVGWNDGQKQRSKMSKRGNQNFVAIPTGRLIKRLEQLCPEYGIVLTLTEESYTSKTSFLDDDFLPKHGVSEACPKGIKPKNWKASGVRVKRGMYRTVKGFLINADCNGAANIARKVAIQLGLNLAKVGRGALTLPKRYDLFSNLTKSYRKRHVAMHACKHERILSGAVTSV